MRLVRFCASVCVLVWSCVVCADDIRVSAAASLTDAIAKNSQQYELANAGVTIKKSFGGSATLAKQIEQGAPTDIYISADVEWMNYLQERRLISSSSQVALLSNELVLIAPLHATKIGITFDVKTPLANLFKGRLCTGDPASVPVGRYAKQALTYYAWWESINTRLVATEDVRTALAFVERGECDLGIVYKTDALASTKVSILGVFPSASHAAIIYPMALIKGANPKAEAFWRYLQGDAASKIFSDLGFSIIH